MKKTDTFEDFLREKHSEQYVGLDDSMCDDEADWIADLDGDELIAYADLYGAIKNRDGYKEAYADTMEIFEKHLTNAK